MPKQVTITAYTIDELGEIGIYNALMWLDESPLDYEKEDGTIGYDYFFDLWYEDNEKEYVIEHCEMNKYLFDDSGKPIHHLIY